MDKKVSLEFAVDGFEYEDVKDARFAKGIIHAFADGENAHTHPIETNVLMDCANSIFHLCVDIMASLMILWHMKQMRHQ